MVTQGIKIVSDIFDRMDMDRKIIESLRKLQTMDGLSEAEFYAKKQALMRRLTAKNTKFLYEKEKKPVGESLREMAAKKAHEEKINRARLNREASSLSLTFSQSSPSKKASSMSVVRKQSSNRNSRLDLSLNSRAGRSS